MCKKYLGDGVYVEVVTGPQLKLTTTDGYSDTNVIFLEVEVLRALQNYITRLNADALFSHEGKSA